MVSGMDHEIANEIMTDFSIYHKALGEQFDKLIYRPLQKVETTLGTCRILVVAVDILDKCENERDIDTLLDLWSRLPQITSVRLKLFLTSRPELPIRLKFNSIPCVTDQGIWVDFLIGTYAKLTTHQILYP
jgi:hypothetical protein